MPRRSTTTLAVWLRAQMKERGLTQTALAERAGIAVGTVDSTLHRNHIPKIESLFQLAEVLETSRLDILLITGHLCRADSLPGAPQPREDHPDESHLEGHLLEEFRLLPPELRPDAVSLIQTFRCLAKVHRYQLIGDEEEPAPSRSAIHVNN